jgi:ribosomal protein S17
MVKEKETKQKEESPQKTLAAAPIATRGRTFEGTVTKKFPMRIVLEFERVVRVPKYERFCKKKTRLHARLPDSMAADINVGDYVQLKECRRLSKLIHFVVIKKIRSKEDNKQ